MKLTLQKRQTAFQFAVLPSQKRTSFSPNPICVRPAPRTDGGHVIPWRRSVAPRHREAHGWKRTSPTCLEAEPKWSQLSADEFDKLVSSDALPVCFIGMSNCGKSHWSYQLHDTLEFDLFSVDDHIEDSLKDILSQEGHVGISGLANWMGFPSDAQFAKHQAIYLAAEESITAGAAVPEGRNCVLDTTGSVVYLTDAVRNLLMKHYLVIHLEASDDLLDVMTENYFQTPKPVVWGDAYNRQDGETVDEALRRCYPNLLKERRDRYARMAHVTIPAATCLSTRTVKAFLNELRSRLPSVV